MSRTSSPSANRPYGLARVCRVWRMARSSVYAALGRAAGAAAAPARKRGPAGACTDEELLAHDLEECQFFFSRLDSPALRWSFTVNHAHLTPDGIDGFLDALDLGRCGEVRLADCRGTIEDHLYPGQGSIDFAAMFARIEREGYRGHYMQAFGSLDDMLLGRETLAAMAGCSNSR